MRDGVLRLAAALALLLASVAGGTAVAGGDLQALIEVKGRYYRAGEPVTVRVTVTNAGDEAVPAPEGIPIVGSLVLSVDGKDTAPVGVPEFDPATQPRLFLPGTGIQHVLDLVPYFPALARAGDYRLRLQHGELASEAVTLSLAPAFDDALDYHATFKTDVGDIVFDLLEDAAPDHVRNFVDLARRGVYNDTLFHVIAKGEIIVGGDPEGDGSGSIGYVLPPEISPLPHERGTLAAVRTQGPDSGSQFFISLRRNPEWDGNFTIFGKMTGGGEALAALENVTTSGRVTQPFFRPLQETYLRGVVIEGRTPSPAEGETGAGTEVDGG